MSRRRVTFFLCLAVVLMIMAGTATRSQLYTQAYDGRLIAGRNVNMVSGTKLPLGDPWLQRQNEPSGAASSRNPMHLFFAANDYRTIDMPEDFAPRGIPGVSAARDAWIGVFESFDGGESHVSMLLPGFPQDTSAEALASPIHGFDTACDPIVRAGANGLFYLSGIAFNRSQLSGAVFVARYVDSNDREKIEEVTDLASGFKKYRGPINYLDTRLADAGNPGQFIDMPNMAVDIPRAGAPNGFGNIYLAYTVFLGNTDINVRSRVVFKRSMDGGTTWSGPIKLTESQHIIQRPVIVIDPSDITGKTIYVVFRRFSHTTFPGGIVLVKSVDGGLSFSKPADVATLLCPFDQWTKGENNVTSFRTNSYPTMAVDGNGVVYIAWAQRYGTDGQLNPDGQARIVFTCSTDGGLTWLGPRPVDSYNGSGHQFMPSMTCAGGKVTVMWYDQRDDIALHDPAKPHDARAKFIEDSWQDHRHTIDVRAAEAPAGAPLSFAESVAVSRYLYFMTLDENGDPYMGGDGKPLLWQGEYDFVDLPLFYLGTKPFHGDYIELAPSAQILPPPVAGSWTFNVSEPTSIHGAWADNRNVWPPAGDLWGDWVNYNPPTSAQDGEFGLNPTPCNNANTTGMRNQNIYTANLNHGVIVGSPGNSKQLDIQRTFVVFVKDTIGAFDLDNIVNRTFQLTLDGIGSDIASFDQSDGNAKTLSIDVPPYSSVSNTIYVSASGGFKPVRVNVRENGSLVGYVILNPDSTNNPLLLGDEIHDPMISNPKIWKYDVGNQKEPNASFLAPRAQNPRAQNSGYIAPRAQNPRAQNPRAQNPRAQNPRAQNENIVNMEMYNPRAQNPRAQNTALTDMTWTVTNVGNTTSAYYFNIASDSAEFRSLLETESPLLIAQVLVYRMHMAPIDDGCQLAETHADELIVNIANPRAQNPRAQNTTPTSANSASPAVKATTQQTSDGPDISFYLAPGEAAEVILRVLDPDTTDDVSFDDFIDNVGGEVVAEAINTGGTAPSYDTQDDPPWVTLYPEIGAYPVGLSFTAMQGGADPAAQPLTIWNAATGGVLNYSITEGLTWLSVNPTSGTSASQSDEQNHYVSVIIGGLAAGTYSGEITITDPNATNNPVRIPVTLTIYAAPPSEEWVARYDGLAHVDDTAAALTTDSDGNVYVTGAGTFPDTGRDIVTIKYNTAGSVVWSSRYDAGNGLTNNNDSPTAIAVDSSGNVCVTGTQEYGALSNQRWITIKYNNAGVRQWAKAYDANTIDDAIPRALAVDSTGNVYVTGESAPASDIDSDFVTIKYGPSGEQLWLARYDGIEADLDDRAKALALDSSGNVYVAGTSQVLSTGSFNFVLIKYNSSGVEQWARSYDNAAGSDQVSAMALDSSGNIYVGGSSNKDTDIYYDFCTVKYDSGGAFKWAQTYDRLGYHDLLNAMAVDSAGNVYVTGRSDDGSVPPISDYVTIKYDPDSTQQWVAVYDGPDHVQDVAWDIAADSAGNVYVVGESDGPGTSFDYAAIKYDTNGNELWVRRYNGPGNFNDSAAAVAVDPEGYVLIAGSSAGSGTGMDFATIRYRPTLEEWVARYNGPGNGGDDARAIAVDASGNVCVTGSSIGSGTDRDYATIKYNSAGVEQWVARYNGQGNGFDIATGIAVDAFGNIYVTGSSTGSGTSSDFATIKYSSSGGEQWVARYNGPANGSDGATGIAVDASGNIYVTGSSMGSGTDRDYTTIKYNSSGVEQWVARYNGPGNGSDDPVAIALDASGNVYVTGNSPRSGTDYDYATVKYDSLGAEQWVARYSGPAGSYDQVRDMAVDPSGNVYLAGFINVSGNDDYVTIKYNSSGVEQWVAVNNAPPNGLDVARAIAVDSSGNVCVTGQSIPPGPMTTDWLTIKYNSAGVAQWSARYAGLLVDESWDIAVDTWGNVFVTGYSGYYPGNINDYATLKYDSAGVEQYVIKYNGPGNGNDTARAMAVDSLGNIYVTGSSTGSGTGLDWATIKYRKS